MMTTQDTGAAMRPPERSRTATLRRLPLGVLSLVCGLSTALLTGCGYTLGYRAPPGVTTIAVPIFDNHTFPTRREVEHDLTDAFRKQIQLRTSLILTDQSKADMVVYGTIQRFREHVVAEGRVDQKIESNISVQIELIVEDHRNRKRSREVVTRLEPLSIQAGETFEAARIRAIANLAERLVTRIEDWSGGAVDSEASISPDEGISRDEGLSRDEGISGNGGLGDGETPAPDPTDVSSTGSSEEE